MLSSKLALAAAGTPGQLHILNAVILVVSVFSAIGAALMILSFVLFQSARSFRHQLILGLSISDFLMAINFMSSTATHLSGHALNDKSCNINGFATQWFVVQTDYWVLMIAVCTFFMLADFRRQSSWVQSHRMILWAIPWGFSALWAAIGLGIPGYGNIGAWCWFTSDRVRLLVNFIPRWIIVITMLALYTRLYFILYRAHERFTSMDEEQSGSTRSRTVTIMDDTKETASAASTTQLSEPMSETKGQRRGRVSTYGRPTPVLKKLAYQMMTYPLIYMLIWIIPTSIRIYQASTGKSAPFSIATVDKACIVIQGLIDAMIYGFNERATLTAWKGLLFGTKR